MTVKKTTRDDEKKVSGDIATQVDEPEIDFAQSVKTGMKILRELLSWDNKKRVFYNLLNWGDVYNKLIKSTTERSLTLSELLAEI